MIFSKNNHTSFKKIKNIYSDLEQQIPENNKKGGLVSINFVDAVDSEEYEEKNLRIFVALLIT